MKCTTKDI